VKYGTESKRKSLAVLISMTVLTLLAIILLAALVRMDIKAEARKAASYKLLYAADENYDRSELVILSMLEGMPLLYNSKGGEEAYWSLEHINLLAKYFEEKDVLIDDELMQKLYSYIQGSHEILKFEEEMDLDKISLDSKRMIMLLYKDIFELFGLKISYGMSNDIEAVFTEDGHALYQRVSEEAGMPIHMEALMLTVLLIMMLTFMYILIVRKKSQIIRNGDYNGYDEKEYA